MTKLPHEQLADDLMDAGLAEMSFAAREYRYHDFRSPLASPTMALVDELTAAMRAMRESSERARFYKIVAIRSKAIDGKYDATKAESDEWAASPEGQDAFGRLAKGQ